MSQQPSHLGHATPQRHCEGEVEFYEMTVDPIVFTCSRTPKAPKEFHTAYVAFRSDEISIGSLVRMECPTTTVSLICVRIEDDNGQVAHCAEFHRREWER